MKQHPSIGRLIGHLHRESRRYFERKMANFGLSSGAHLLLKMLFRQDGIIQNDLSKQLHFDKANITRGIQKLEEKGFIRRERDEHDSRAYRIFLTEKALEIKPAVKKAFLNWTRILTGGFSPEEKKLAMDLLRRMETNAMDHNSSR